MRKATYHLHTTWCDGTASPAQMLQAAIERGFTDIAFTAHAAWPFATEWHLPVKAYQRYRQEIDALALKAPIRVFTGFEADFIDGITAPDYSIYRTFGAQILIGSVHYVPGEGATPWSVDGPAEEVAAGITNSFAGNAEQAVRAYWACVRKMIEVTDADIIGHLDIIRKRNKTLAFFDEDAPWYKEEEEKTVECIAKTDKVVEINTGGIARKAIDDVYPSTRLLTLLCQAGVKITLSSDAHAAEDLDTGYEKARQSALKAGFTGLWFFEGDEWTQEAL